MTEAQQTVYQMLVAAGIPVENHYSDLYVQATPEALDIVRKAGKRCESFVHQIHGNRWLDIPFSFDPYWEMVERKSQSRVK